MIHRKQLVKLERVKVIERRQVPSKTGRGRIFHLHVRHTEQTEKLLKALGKGQPKKRTT